ncbi:MAG: DNA recombination/repair protein RecA [bacterium]|nr:DNA recombination/repair protein RecA [bacterium]
MDRSLTGGLPRGCLIEVTGRNSSGRFSLVLSTLAATTAAGDVAAFVDLGDSLDPGNASDLGVDLDRLLWLRPKHLKPALVAAEIALQTGFPLVILDLGEPPVCGGRGPEAAWLRLTRAAAARQSVVCVSSPYRVSGTAATTVFETERAESSWRGGNRAPYLLEAIRFHWKLRKTRHNSFNRRVSFTLSSPEAFLGKLADTRFVASNPRVDRKKTVETELDRYRATQSASL